MASSASTNVTSDKEKPAGIRIPWTSLIWFAVLICLPFFVIIAGTVRDWLTEEEMGHGIFIPFVVGYMIWIRREEIFGATLRPSWWGLSLVIWGFVQVILGTVGADLFLARTGVFIVLVGSIWTVAGFRMLRTLAFPLFLLLFTIRLPQFLYSKITFPLQLFASRLAAEGLSLLGIPVMREGNVLELASQKLDVVEACSGIRSLISLSFLALVYAWFFDRKAWMRWVLLAAAVPIAIAANAGRIILTGVLSEYNKEFAVGAYHEFEGWVIFMADLVILIGLHALLNRVYGTVRARWGK